MTIEVLPQAFTVCKVTGVKGLDLSAPFTFAAHTDGEYSLVCPSDVAPTETVAREDGWRAVRVAGTMVFSLVGILACITGLLAEAQVPVFAVSTFDTDYCLVKAADLPRALAALRDGGCTVLQKSEAGRENS